MKKLTFLFSMTIIFTAQVLAQKGITSKIKPRERISINDGWKFYATQTSPLLGKGEPIWALLEKLTSNTTFSQWRENKLQLRLFQLEDIEFSVNIEDFRKDFEQLSNTPLTDPLEESPFTP